VSHGLIVLSRRDNGKDKYPVLKVSSLTWAFGPPGIGL
jgi:hypothetical protein